MENEDAYEYENVAWMGGSYAPPTNAHIKVALAMGHTLLDNTAKDKKCAVCIVPVSNKYDKGSVNEDCVPDDQRREIIAAFVAVVSAMNLMSQHDRKNNLHFKYMDYELNYINPETKMREAVPTIKSMDILKTKISAEKYYIAQGQDNIMDIMKRKWVRSLDLLDYPLIMYPRGDIPSKDLGAYKLALKADVDKAMNSDHVGTKNGSKYEEIISEIGKEAYDRKQTKIFEDLIIVPTSFNDDSSSTAVRHYLREGDFEKVKGMMNEHVYNKLMEYHPIPYTSPLCEVKPSTRAAAAGGAAAGGAAAGAGGKGGRRRHRKSKKGRAHRSRRRKTRR